MSLTIVRDRPSRRRAYGINAPLFVTVAGGERVRAREWSHLGLVLPDEALPPLDGGLVHAVLHLNFQGYEIGVPAKAKVDETGEAAVEAGFTRLEFVELSDRSAQLIEHFVEDFVRGRIVPAQDTLVRIDAPPEPISTKPDKSGDGEEKRSWKPLIMTAFYLLLGTAVMAYIAVLLYANYIRLEVRTAVVSRPIEIVRMADSGALETIDVKVGDVVPPGGIIGTLGNPGLDERIERARAVVETASNATKRARKRVRIDLERIEDYQLLDDADRRERERVLEKARVEWIKAVAKLRATVALTDENARGTIGKDVRKGALGWAWNQDEWGHACFGRLKPREMADLSALLATFPRPDTIKNYRRKDLVDCATYVRLYRDAAAKRKVMAKAEADAKTRLKLDKLSDRRLYNGREFVVDIDVSRLSLDKAKANEKEAEAVLVAMEAARNANAIRTALGGRVTSIRTAPGVSLQRGETIAVVEADVPPIVEAYLTQEEAEIIGVGDEVDAFIPALDRTLEARVATVDRTAGFIDELNSRHVWRGPKDRSALARLVIVDREAGEDLLSGLPVTALFHRRSPSIVTEQAAGEARGLAEAVPGVLGLAPDRRVETGSIGYEPGSGGGSGAADFGTPVVPDGWMDP